MFQMKMHKLTKDHLKIKDKCIKKQTECVKLNRWRNDT